MKVYLDTIGCRLNQSEIETYARQFIAAGHKLVGSPAEADLAVINTCDVTAAAAADSRKKIRGATRAGSGEVVATGCWATLNPEGAQTLPGVEHVILNQDKENLVPEILQIAPETFAETFDLEPLIRQPVPGARLRTRAFIKVQDGCDNRCTFCVTTVARGQGRSISVDRILADINAAIMGGTQEIVLTGVHLGSWGQDFETPRHLLDLVETILTEAPITRLRLSSLEPWDLDENFFSLWQDNRLARHLHLPLQSGSSATLKRMARKITSDGFRKLMEAARARIPHVAITTDMIAGFPGETATEFAETLMFVEKMNFAGGHVFSYSERPGTAAAKMPHQVPHPLRKERNATLRALFEQSAAAYRDQFVGKRLSVLWETATPNESGGWSMSGLTDNYLRVTTQTTQQLWNQVTPVQLTEIKEGVMVGKIISS